MTPVPHVLGILVLLLVGGAVLGLLAVFGVVLGTSKDRGKILRMVLTIIGLVALVFGALLFFGRFVGHAAVGPVARMAVFPWILVGLVVLGVIGLVALARSGKAGGAIAGVLVVAVLLGGLLASFLIWSRVPMRVERIEGTAAMRSRETVVSGSSTLPVTTAGSGVEEAPAIWHEGVELEMPAEVYPSLESAVGALAVAAGPLVEKALGGESRPGQVLIYQTPENSGVVGTFRRRLKERQGLDAEIVQTVDSGGGPAAGGESDIQQHALIFKLRVENERLDYVAGDDAEMRQRTGVLDLTVQGPAGTADVQAAYHEKPWLVDFAAFQSRHRDRAYVLARSSSPAVSQEQAAREALVQATGRVNKLLKLTAARTPDRLLGGVTVDPVSLEQHGLIVDRFDQRFYGAAGPIWRSAVLVDVSPETLQPLIQTKTATMRVERMTWAGMLLRLLGLGALVTVVYVFLDTATRGYYTWSLRIAAAALAIVGVVIVLLLA